MDTVSFKFQTFAFKQEVCEMGGNFWLENGLNLLCRSWPCSLRPKQAHVPSQLEASHDFSNLWLFFKKCDFFFLIRKNSFSLEISTF